MVSTGQHVYRTIASTCAAATSLTSTIEYLNAPISSRNFISSTTFPIFYAICMRNHHILIGNVAAATSLTSTIEYLNSQS